MHIPISHTRRSDLHVDTIGDGPWVRLLSISARIRLQIARCHRLFGQNKSDPEPSRDLETAYRPRVIGLVIIMSALAVSSLRTISLTREGPHLLWQVTSTLTWSHYRYLHGSTVIRDSNATSLSPWTHPVDLREDTNSHFRRAACWRLRSSTFAQPALSGISSWAS